ncbi:MAG: mechanosensitive ion channel family protein [Acidobacteria bacterium]|nr:mechanosensitive ion channel family protein [Acidobacteriota bacterium]
MLRLILAFLSITWMLPAQETRAPVRFEGREILEIRAGVPPFTAELRAAEVERRLASLAESKRLPVITIVELPEQKSFALVSGDFFVLLTTSADAAAYGVPTAKLAAEWAAAINKSLAESKQSHSFAAYFTGALKTVAAWSAFALLIFLLRRSYQWAAMMIRGWVQKETAARQARGFSLQLWERAASIVFGAVKFTIAIFLLFQFSFVLSYTFGLFPQTANISTTFLDYLKSVFTGIASGFLQYLPNGGVVIIVALLTHYLLSALKLMATAIQHGDLSIPGFHPEMSKPTFQLVRILVCIFALVVAFPYLPGSGSDAFKGISIMVGVLISFGSGSSVSNILAGLVLTYMRPFRVGDRVKIADALGDVLEKTLLVTRVRTIKNVEVVIPNSAILGNQILNYSAMVRTRGLILHTTITIGYDAPWREVHQALIDAALATEAILPDPRPFVLQTSLNDFNVAYEINAYTDRPNEFEFTYARLHSNIQDSFNRAGIEIMSPNYFAVRDGNTVTIPEAHRPPGYTPPGFRIEP